jgi:hypothetical protein
LIEIEGAGLRHAVDLDENAYAVLNAVTKLASRPPPSLLACRDGHGLQRRAGQWVGEFAAICVDPMSDLEAHLRSLADKEQRTGESAAVRMDRPRTVAA